MSRSAPRARALIVLFAALLVAGHLMPVIGTIPTAGAAGAQTTAWLNLRAGPSGSNHIKLVMPPGSFVELLSNLGRSGYYKVAYENELGYAHSDFLSVGGNDGGQDPGSGDAGTAYTTDALNLRAGPSTSNGVKLVIPSGAAVTLTGESRNGFASVRYDGTNGWASSDYLSSSGGSEDPGDGDGGTAYTTSALNLRAGPSTSNGVKLVIPSGAAVGLTGDERNGFAGVRYNGTSGWASTDYLSSSGGAPDPDDGGGGGGGGTMYTTTALNLRAGPSVSNGVKLVMPAGAAVRRSGGERNGYAGVRYNGTSGWASLEYLTSDGGGDDGGGNDGSYSEREIIQIIYDAADRYGQSRSAMLRVARCESVLDPNAYNASSAASGLFQFLPGTWATTPFADESIFDPVASANAAGWMWSVGRRNEWVC